MGAPANKLEKENEKALVEDVQWNQGQPCLRFLWSVNCGVFRVNFLLKLLKSGLKMTKKI